MRYFKQVHTYSIALLTLTFMAFSQPVAAGGQAITVAWEPITPTIPTLGTWGLIIAAALLGVVGLRLLRDKQAATRFMSVCLLGAGLVVSLEAVTGPLISPPLGIFDEDCQGGSLEYNSSPTQSLANTCPNAVQIVDYTYPEIVPDCAELIESCPVGQVLSANSGVCTLNYYDFSTCE